MRGLALLIFCFILFTGYIAACGGGGGGGGYSDGDDDGYGDDGSDDGDEDQAWADIAPLVATNCGGCHDGVKHPLKFDSGAAFKASKAKAKISKGLMPPPPKVLAEDTKAKMLAYLN